MKKNITLESNRKGPGRPNIPKEKKRETLSISLDPWVKEWLGHQKKGGMSISRMVQKAIICYNKLEPPCKILKKIYKKNGNTPT